MSVSGDRQVLTIPETGSTHVGTISCVAENAAGKAICSARLDIGESYSPFKFSSERKLEYYLYNSTFTQQFTQFIL